MQPKVLTALRAVVAAAVLSLAGALFPAAASAVQRAPAPYLVTARAATDATFWDDPDSAIAALALAAEIPGRLSLEGLPPIPGVLQLSPRAVLFHPDNGVGPLYFPLFRQSAWARVPGRRPAIQLYSVDSAGPSAVFMYHLDGAVFETASPGALRSLAENSAWVDSLSGTVSPDAVPLVAPDDRDAMMETIRELATSPYADTLYRLFGAPDRPIGLVSKRGQAVGRLGEYVGSRDSISLAPAAMIHPEQLRHGLAHELAHRWQRREKRTLGRIWKGVAPISDSLRYGFRSNAEHQAEAVAFAVHYLQATAGTGYPAGARLVLLESYERLVPGTRRLVRYFLEQPVYSRHPLVGHSLAAPRVVSIHGACAGLETGRAGTPGACSLIVTD
ncbi:MAG: hypothetical protein M3Y31_10875 [Gemmatimonadota bacterium]|nr:hypothetical protein [Gemmatimonadota bacterium]